MFMAFRAMAETYKNMATPVLIICPGVISGFGAPAVQLCAAVALKVPVGVADYIPPRLHHEDVSFARGSVIDSKAIHKKVVGVVNKTLTVRTE